MALQQWALSTVDWVLAASVLYLLLPPGAPPFLTFLGSFLVAVLLGLASHVPGGIGVFEGLMVVLLRPWLTGAELFPAFAVYRAVYYLLPFGVSLIALVWDEAHLRRVAVAQARSWLGGLAQQLTPRVLSAFAFLSGALLLFSGATPASPGRLDLLSRVLPVGVIETSHCLGSIAGAGLLIVSQGLARRLDAAYYFTSLLVIVGMTAALLKGFDVEEGALLLAMLLVLRAARPAFTRRAASFETRFSPVWIATVAGALGASIWLGLFAFKHVDYSGDLWWRFELFGDASRFLRGTVGAAVVILLVALARLMGHPPHEIDGPSDSDVDNAARVVDEQNKTSAHLVFLRDKAVLFNDARDAFVMYGVQGRTWVSMGDPVGADTSSGDMIRRFLERVEYDEPRVGAPRTISDAEVEAVIVKTLETTPKGETHWSTRTMAAKAGMSHTIIGRIWRTFGLQPHVTRSFKLSPDPQLVDNIRDVIGLYMNPPTHAVVFSFDETPQIQALQRAQPIWPMDLGQPERRTHNLHPSRHPGPLRRAERRDR